MMIIQTFQLSKINFLGNKEDLYTNFLASLSKYLNMK